MQLAMMFEIIYAPVNARAYFLSPVDIKIMDGNGYKKPGFALTIIYFSL